MISAAHAAAVGVDIETAMVTTAMPLRTDFPLTTDPFKYRLMELVGVYGDALRERCNELFGDGILSAIDCVVKLDAKLLHYAPLERVLTGTGPA